MSRFFPMNEHHNQTLVMYPQVPDQGEVFPNYITDTRRPIAALDAYRQLDRFCANMLLKSHAYLSKFNYVIRPSSGQCFDMVW
ncbi:unnamed protein product [Hydatigera taeniaeformis]|uniref:Uncharacterized protein n=1 Tax=Hydatigena taeniaeformis TaxID=6205 RepID=A0A0R3X4H3_HYDTA|nr:unnamed protein product [Hydatigera taeniaeformis]